MQGGPVEPGAAAERNQRGGGEGEHSEGEGDEEGEAEKDEGGEGGKAEKEGGEEGSAKEQRGECCWLELASRPPLKAGIWSPLSVELVLRRQGDCEGLPQVKSLPSHQPSVGFELESGLDFEGREGLGEAQVLEEGFF